MGLACVSVRKRRSWDPTTSRSLLGEDQKAPLQFQQPMDTVDPLPLTYSPSGWDCHLAQGREYPEGVDSWITALRSRITAHFPSFRAVVTLSLACLSSAYWFLVRSTLRKILCVGGSRVSLHIARRALSWSSSVRKRKKSVELSHIHAHSRVRSFKSKVSWRKVVPI